MHLHLFADTQHMTYCHLAVTFQLRLGHAITNMMTADQLSALVVT